MQSALSIYTVAYVLYQQHKATAELQTAVCVVRRLYCSTESYKTVCSLARILKVWGKGNS